LEDGGLFFQLSKLYFLKKNIFITLNWILSIGHPSEQTDDIMDLESQNVLKARVNNISAEKGYTFLFLFLGQIEERERENIRRRNGGHCAITPPFCKKKEEEEEPPPFDSTH